MPSKQFPWEFIKSHKETIDVKKPGMWGLHFPDIYCERVFIDRIPRQLGGGVLHTLHASDINVDWLENTINTVDFFSSQDSYLIIESQNLSTAVVKFLTEKKLTIEDRFLIFSFNKSSTIFDKIEKANDGNFIKVESPKFWEFNKYLDFFTDILGVDLSNDAKNYLLSSVESDGASFFNALNILKLYQEDGMAIQAATVKELIGQTKIDNFEMANMFCAKGFKGFFGRLVQIEDDYDGLRGVFSFMQSHLFKIIDTSQTEAKTRQSQYDRAIIQAKRLWQKDDLVRAMQMFSEFEVLAKSKDRALVTQLRLKYFRSPK